MAVSTSQCVERPNLKCYFSRVRYHVKVIVLVTLCHGLKSSFTSSGYMYMTVGSQVTPRFKYSLLATDGFIDRDLDVVIDDLNSVSSPANMRSRSMQYGEPEADMRVEYSKSPG
ncbi:unnamed protein product [Phytophthora lilii]|uniref:Unnamed protein product n=1 Tax=Phytophthora lilii TaxID=2077276 RepID=A0A9W6YI53_9STRA|nr:unnamed protein product [Phytophthora lilii]